MDFQQYFSIFNHAIEFYHIENNISQEYKENTKHTPLESLLHYKCWIDTVQWHCEDEVRSPHIEAEKVRFYKNKIDQLNQERTNLVERLDDYFLNFYNQFEPDHFARINTESLGWAIDRLSILALKIYHMEIESQREGLSLEKSKEYGSKLSLLLEQKLDLLNAISSFSQELEQGKAIYKVYRQVKMYNDIDLNPILRASHVK